MIECERSYTNCLEINRLVFTDIDVVWKEKNAPYVCDFALDSILQMHLSVPKNRLTATEDASIHSVLVGEDYL